MKDDRPSDVIILDDDEDYANLLRLHLRNCGITAVIIDDAERFLDSFYKSGASVCLVDLNMADLAGVQWRFAGASTIVEFRRRFGAAGAKIAVLTGLRNPLLESPCREAGADAFIQKDTPLPEIVARVRDLLEEAKRAAPARNEA